MQLTSVPYLDVSDAICLFPSPLSLFIEWKCVAWRGEYFNEGVSRSINHVAPTGSGHDVPHDPLPVLMQGEEEGGRGQGR